VSSELPNRRMQPLVGLLWDAGIPVFGFYVLHLQGASDWAALLVGTVLAAGRVLWVALRARRITWFAALMLLVFGVGLGLAFLVGDPRLMLVKNSVVTAIIGGLFLASLATRRPLTLIAFQTWRPCNAETLARSYDTDTIIRRIFRRAAWAWGIGMIAEAVLRIPLIYLVPLDVAVAASSVLMLTVVGSLVAWTAFAAARLPA
jgi:hypothetical protein